MKTEQVSQQTLNVLKSVRNSKAKEPEVTRQSVLLVNELQNLSLKEAVVAPKNDLAENDESQFLL